jgi:hypothetical protein
MCMCMCMCHVVMCVCADDFMFLCVYEPVFVIAHTMMKKFIVIYIYIYIYIYTYSIHSYVYIGYTLVFVTNHQVSSSIYVCQVVCISQCGILTYLCACMYYHHGFEQQFIHACI